MTKVIVFKNVLFNKTQILIFFVYKFLTLNVFIFLIDRLVNNNY